MNIQDYQRYEYMRRQSLLNAYARMMQSRGIGGTGKKEDPEVDPKTIPLCFTALEDGSKISFTPIEGNTFQTSTDNSSWTDYTSGSEITLNTNEKVYFRAATEPTEHKCGQFTMNIGKISASGNTMSLLSQNFSELTTFSNCDFEDLFNGCSSLTTAPILPATSFSSDCYSCMFKNCSNLEIGPYIQAIGLDTCCLMEAFSGCRKLRYLRVNHFTDYDSGYYQLFEWMLNAGADVTGEKIFECDSSFVQSSYDSADKVPEGWTIRVVS